MITTMGRDTVEDDKATRSLNNRILIIDDNESIHADFRKTLGSHDDVAELDIDEALLFGDSTPKVRRVPFEIDSAHQGQQGFAKVGEAVAAGRPYAVAFVDMRMPPGWDGVQTIEQLWKQDPNLQVVICTAYSDYSWEQVVDRLGLSDRLLILKKPFDAAEVMQLAIAMREKWHLAREAKEERHHLEKLVDLRTSELRHAAMCDGLTGLPNRTQLTIRLQDTIARHAKSGSAFAVLFLDFDRFKIINDSFGHQVGDQLLVAIANRLRESIADATASPGCSFPATAARLGGDEFVILLEGVRDLTQVVPFAQRMLERLRLPHPLNGMQIYSSASIGITTSEFGYTSPGDVLRDADISMYHAKLAGKDCCSMFDRSMQEETLRRMELETDLRSALERGEFRLVYQPIVSLSDARVVGLESLIRWEHPTRGVVSPLDFIPLAEETGLILNIGRWVMETAVHQLSDWQRKFPSQPPIYMSINLSKRQLQAPGLAQSVRRLIDDAGVEPSSVMLEVTESMIMDAADVFTPVLHDLNDVGVLLAMDDFGTGHSSLSCLHKFPISVLKIDRAFIGNLSDNREYSAVVHAIITLAGNLGMSVTAEGIETPSQLAHILALDCNAGQGWLFARAMSPQACETFLHHGVKLPAVA